MTRKSWLMLITVLALTGVTAGILVHFKYHRQLGQPGLKVVAGPLYDPNGRVVATNQVYLPPKVLNADSQLMTITEEELDWLPKDTTYGRRRYKMADGFWADISVVLMGADRTSIHKPQYCLVAQGFAPMKEAFLTVPIAKPHPYDLQTRIITLNKQFVMTNGQSELGRGVFIYWFVGNQKLTGDHNTMLWEMSKDLLRTGVLERWAYVSIFTIVRPNEEAIAIERLKQIMAAALPDFQLAAGPSATSSAR